MNNNNLLFSHRGSEPENSVLYIVGTPIGNLDDISIRAKNILSKVSFIACEDTRNTIKLLNHLEITNKLISFHKYNSNKKSDFLISKLQNGDSIAIVSDAGMPLISDPGESLVKKIREKDLDVICIPGPNAALTALVSSGLTTTQFTFYGFIPRSGKKRLEQLKLISESKFTSIVYESPKRILKFLVDLKKVCGGERRIAIIKEMTKKFEQHFGYKIDDLIKIFDKIIPMGEHTIVIGSNTNVEEELNEYKDLKIDLINLIKAGLSHSSASNYLSKKSGKSKRDIYNLILENDI